MNIPEQELPTLHRLMELKQETFASVVSAVKGVKATFTHRQFMEKVAEKLPKASAVDIAPIFNTVLALYWMKDRHGISSQLLAEAVSKSAVEASSDKLQFPPEKREILRDRLKTLLDFDSSLGVTAKAVDVMTEHANIFCDARILSDIRPVFTGSPETTSSALIVHNLRIAYHTNGEHKEFYVAMDANDIKRLKQVITRADRKTAVLLSVLNKSDINCLEV